MDPRRRPDARPRPNRLPQPLFSPSKPASAPTLAKLTWSLQHGDLPDWAAAVGPSTLLIIDEAGMADTLTLDAAVQFAIDQGASVDLGRPVG
ncbi:MAG: AAA family ATPase [Mycobacterium sp.]